MQMREGRRDLLMKELGTTGANRLNLGLALLAGFWLANGLVSQCQADSTYVYAVQLSAEVQTNPPQITLNWEPDPYGAASYAIFRKAEQDTDWGTAVASLPGYLPSYTDSTVERGKSYEYRVVKNAVLGYVGYGYIYSGIEAPPIEARGTVVLVVAT